MDQDPPKEPEHRPPPPRAQSQRTAVSWDCVDCHVIDDEQSMDIRDRGENADKYWQDGWIVNLGGIKRTDFDVDERGRYHRVYPTRYWVDRFETTASMRRVLAKNSDLKIVTRPLRITPAKEDLYLAHHLSRFGCEPRELLNKRYEYIVHHPARLMETCYFLGSALIAFSIFEEGDYSLWSNIGVWSPAHPERSLGTLTILKEIEHARARGDVFYYMGTYWPGHPSYEYKTRFRALELYDWDDRRWRPFGHPITKAMLTERLRRRSDDE